MSFSINRAINQIICIIEWTNEYLLSTARIGRGKSLLNQTIAICPRATASNIFKKILIFSLIFNNLTNNKTLTLFEISIHEGD